MIDTLKLKFWEPFFRASKVNGGCPIKVVYGCPEGKTSIIYDDINKAENVLVYGTSGSGKSTFLNVFIKGASMFNTVEDVRLVLVDSKRVEFNQYKDSELLLCPIINNSDDLLTVINRLIDECVRRKELLKNGKFEEKHQRFPYILLVIDEYTDIANNEINNALTQLMKDGYQYGIHIVLSTQNIGKYVGDIDFFKTFKTVICQANFQGKESYSLIGENCKLNGSGDSIILHNKELTRVQGLWTFYNEDLSARVDEYVSSIEAWVFEMLVKHNEEVLVPVDDGGKIITNNKTVTIFNTSNYLKADKFDKHQKIKIKFRSLMKIIRSNGYLMRLENGNCVFYT